jgi:DNA polymerase
VISLDYETRCELDLRKVGLDRYTSHASFAVLMAAYRIDDGPLCHWEAHKQPLPQDLRERLLDPKEEKWAFNAQFERITTIRGLGIATPVEGWRCSMVLAYMRSFMGGLGDVGEQMFLPDQKQKIGSRLIRRFCMPQKVSRNQPHEWRDWRTDPHDWQLFCDYNKTDVIAEEAVRDRLLPFPTLEDEWEFYALDQRINDTGMPLDRQFAENVARMSERRRNELLAQMRQWTGLDNPNSQQALLQWLQSQGYEAVDLREHSVTRALNLHEAGQSSLTNPCVEVLRLRQWAARAATKKAQAALRSAGDDDRIRYMFQFVGASRTGRASGRLVQPQNLTRTPKLFDPEKSTERLDVVTNLIRAGDYDTIDLMVDEPMMVFGGTMRGMFRAREGYRLHVCDYSSIESVGLAWVSGCERMLDVFRQGRDAYRDFGTVLYKKSYDEITSAERQVCKPAVLAAGYGMGPGQILPDGTKTGLLAYAANMGVPMTPTESVAAIAVYRDTYEEVPMLWRACDNAVASVLDNGRPVEIGPLVFEWCRPFLLIRLPSGRCIYYYKPQIEEREIKSKRWRWNKDHMRMEEETYKKNILTFMGRNQRNTQWERIDGRGSHLVENITQALTRDILKIGLMRLDAEGFHIIGHAHDEIIVEGNERTWEHMREIMRQPIDWLPGFPLNASGYSSVYYRK